MRDAIGLTNQAQNTDGYVTYTPRNQQQIIDADFRFAKSPGVEAQRDDGNHAKHEGIGHIAQSVTSVLA